MDTVRYTTHILRITATCFGYLNMTIVRLYKIIKGSYLHKGYGSDPGLTKMLGYT